VGRANETLISEPAGCISCNSIFHRVDTLFRTPCSRSASKEISLLSWIRVFLTEFTTVTPEPGESIVERSRPQMSIWRMWIVCWLPKATNAHAEYVILIVFSLQHSLLARASVLGYTPIASLVINALEE
jgi:hypothetical protein